jgi:cytoplasmic iron level regulating protein YaaA (DUF328/UPF0246 family)
MANLLYKLSNKSIGENFEREQKSEARIMAEYNAWIGFYGTSIFASSNV